METDYLNQIKSKPIAPKSKIPVEVLLTCKKDGKMIPMFIKWENGCIYQIEKIVDIKPRGINNIIYHIMVQNKRTTLYYENRLWMVEMKA